MSPASEPAATEPVAGLRARKKARTKAAIQHHALRLFLDQGYAQTTVEQIAAAAEVSPSTFFRYFPTKEETVLTDLIDARTLDLALSAPPELSPVRAIQYAVERSFAQFSDEELHLEFARNALIRTVPELQRGMLAEITRPMQMVLECLAARTGRDPDDADLRAFSGALVGGILFLTAAVDLEILAADGGPADSARLRELMQSLATAIGELERVLVLPPR